MRIVSRYRECYFRISVMFGKNERERDQRKVFKNERYSIAIE